MHLSTILFTLSAASTAVAVCPGYNWAVGSMQTQSDGSNTWTVYDDKCKATDTVTSKDKSFNVCTAGTFGCDSSSPPVINQYTAKNKLIYDCRPDGRAGKCGNNAIAVCVSLDSNTPTLHRLDQSNTTPQCRNDGKKLESKPDNPYDMTDIRAGNFARPS
jgi:hypothetical protein